MYLTPRQRPWFDVLLTAATISAVLFALGQVSGVLFWAADVLYIFFFAWLLAFSLYPLVRTLSSRISWVSHRMAVAIVYGSFLFLIGAGTLALAASLAGSLGGLIESLSNAQQKIPALVAPLQAQLDAAGININLAILASGLLDQFQLNMDDLIGVATSLAGMSIGAVGQMLLVLTLSFFMIIDAERLIDSTMSLVPQRYAPTVRVLRRSVGRSFGGFIRGQLLLAGMFTVVTAALNVALGLDNTLAVSGGAFILEAFPFFGPLVSWLPQAISTGLTRPDLLPLVLFISIGSSFVIMNIIAPRVMSGAVGIHPLAVLGAVIIGAKIAGVLGVIFGVPVAAVLSALLWHVVELRRGAAAPSEAEPDPGEGNAADATPPGG